MIGCDFQSPVNDRNVLNENTAACSSYLEVTSWVLFTDCKSTCHLRMALGSPRLKTVSCP